MSNIAIGNWVKRGGGPFALSSCQLLKSVSVFRACPVKSGSHFTGGLSFICYLFNHFFCAFCAFLPDALFGGFVAKLFTFLFLVSVYFAVYKNR